MQSNYLWLGVGLVLALLLAGGILFLRPNPAVAPTGGNTATTTGATGSTTEVSLGNGVTATLPPGVTIKPVPSVEAPSLNVAVTYDPNLPADAVSVLKTDIASTTAYLKNNPSDGSEWLQLAVYYKIAGDYTAAANVWGYMTQVAPTSYIAFGDLGDLYQNFLTNYPKAEANYKAAIAIDPNIIDYYVDLYNLYKYEVNNPAAASSTLEAGLKANPGNNELVQLEQ